MGIYSFLYLVLKFPTRRAIQKLDKYAFVSCFIVLLSLCKKHFANQKLIFNVYKVYNRDQTIIRKRYSFV